MSFNIGVPNTSKDAKKQPNPTFQFTATNAPSPFANSAPIAGFNTGTGSQQPNAAPTFNVSGQPNKTSQTGGNNFAQQQAQNPFQTGQTQPVQFASFSVPNTQPQQNKPNQGVETKQAQGVQQKEVAPVQFVQSNGGVKDVPLPQFGQQKEATQNTTQNTAQTNATSNSKSQAPQFVVPQFGQKAETGQTKPENTNPTQVNQTNSSGASPAQQINVPQFGKKIDGIQSTTQSPSPNNNNNQMPQFAVPQFGQKTDGFQATTQNQAANNNNNSQAPQFPVPQFGQKTDANQPKTENTVPVKFAPANNTNAAASPAPQFNPAGATSQQSQPQNQSKTNSVQQQVAQPSTEKKEDVPLDYFQCSLVGMVLDRTERNLSQAYKEFNETCEDLRNLEHNMRLEIQNYERIYNQKNQESQSVIEQKQQLHSIDQSQDALLNQLSFFQQKFEPSNQYWQQNQFTQENNQVLKQLENVKVEMEECELLKEQIEQLIGLRQQNEPSLVRNIIQELWQEVCKIETYCMQKANELNI